jgi:hypothetical protein
MAYAGVISGISRINSQNRHGGAHMSKLKIATSVAAALVSLALSAGAQAQQTKPRASKEAPAERGMTFFISSVGSGKGADFGGLAGADRHCQSLAQAAGAAKHTWRAYLSTTSAGGGKAENARDRIGKGPWYNAEGRLVARNVQELHEGVNSINRSMALTEKKTVVNGRADTPNQHDILTGSMPDGRTSTAPGDTTCANWTSSSAGSALVGHHDRHGLQETESARSWNSSHPSKGCSQANLVATGGAGLIYCFAAK